MHPIITCFLCIFQSFILFFCLFIIKIVFELSFTDVNSNLLSEKFGLFKVRKALVFNKFFNQEGYLCKISKISKISIQAQHYEEGYEPQVENFMQELYMNTC